MRTAFSIIMVLCSMVLMQIHSIDFWTDKAGPSGWAWSIGLEVAMLWFWYENKRRLQVFKYLAAFLLIAGPWYQITAPTFDSLQSVTVIQAEVEAAQGRVTQLSTSLDRYEIRSDKRSGWAGRIDKTQRSLEEGRAKLSGLRSKEAKKETPWRSRAVAGMQAAALLIVLTAQLAAVTSLRSRNGSTVPIRNETKRNDTPKRNVAPEQSTDDFDASVETVAAEIRSLIPSFGSQTKLAKHYGIRPANITAVLNHKERKETGGEIISAGGLAKIVEAMG